ncbi:MAG: serine protease [Actinomycetota bacterium]
MRDGVVMEGVEPSSSGWRTNLAVAAVVAVAALGVGVVLGRVTASDTVVPAANVLPQGDVIVETEVAGAVEVRTGPLTPVATDHLLVVAVSATTCDERATGTGVLIAPDMVLTAAHVVGDAGLVRIDHEGATFTAEVLGVFEDGRDLALLSLPAPLLDPVPVAAAPATGEPVTIVGHPFGGARTSMVGPVIDVPGQASAVMRGDLLGVEAPTEQGMSGGPAVDADGALVGVLAAAQPGTGTAIVITFDDVQPLLDAPLVDGRCPEFT